MKYASEKPTTSPPHGMSFYLRRKSTMPWNEGAGPAGENSVLARSCLAARKKGLKGEDSQYEPSGESLPAGKPKKASTLTSHSAHEPLKFISRISIILRGTLMITR